MITIDSNIQSTRSLEAKRPTSLEQRARALVRARDLVCNGVGHSILGRRVALRRVKQNILAAHVIERRSLNVRTVSYPVVIVENPKWRSDLGEAVIQVDLLDEDWSFNDGFDGVAALTAVADGVAVDFVDDVAFVLLHVVEAANVDGAALLDWADPGLGRIVDEGSFDVLACCVAETMDCAVALQSRGVVENVLPTRQRNDIWCPDSGVLLIYPRREFRHCVFLATELPVLPIPSVCHGDVDFLAVNRHLGGVRSPAIVCSDDRRVWEISATKAW